MASTSDGGSGAVRTAASRGDGRLERKTVGELVIEALRERILSGEYAEGEPLRQDALAADLGVSRIPVREALYRLEAEGLVTFNAHSGAVVSTLSLAEIEELFELRAMIESDLLKRAIPNLEEADLDRADEVLDAYEAAFDRGDIAEWGALNWEFHSILLSPAERPFTFGIVQTLQNQSDRYIRMQLALTHGEGQAKEEHRAIADAARGRKVQHASTLLASHILSAGRSLLQFLEEHRSDSAAGSR